jgi:hypothetical protein
MKVARRVRIALPTGRRRDKRELYSLNCLREHLYLWITDRFCVLLQEEEILGGVSALGFVHIESHLSPKVESCVPCDTGPDTLLLQSK